MLFPCLAVATWDDSWVTVILFLDRERGAHVELPVAALVIPPPHIFQGREFNLLDRSPGSLSADELSFVAPADGLGEGVDAPLVVNSFLGPCCRWG